MKPKAINPKETTRSEAFELWMSAPNPMVTFFKQINVTNLVRISKKYKLKFNMLLCWCIGKAASEVKEFYILPVQGKLYWYDKLVVNTIVRNKNGEVSSCDVPFSKKLLDFNKDYMRLTKQVADSCMNYDLPEYMVIGTSAIVNTEIDGAVGMNSGIFNNSFLIWGRRSLQNILMQFAAKLIYHHGTNNNVEWQEKKDMKNKLFLMISVIMVCSLCSCGQQQKTII